jgi:hypothetical protein
MVRFFTLAVALVLLSACSKTGNIEDSSGSIDSLSNASADSIATDYTLLENYIHTDAVDTTDLETIDYDCAVLIYPTEEQIETMKNEYGEDDFYTIADDSQYYQAAAIEKLDSAGIVQVVSNTKRFLTFNDMSRDWTLDVRRKGFPAWNIVFFKKTKAPKVVFAIDVTNDSIQAYFNK